MKIYLSIAASSDGYIDDLTPHRLRLSTAEDWDEVCGLRTRFDAILVGASTIRNDNPSLRIKDGAQRERRRCEGLPDDLVRVTLTASGNLPADARFFAGGGRAVVITSNPTYTHPAAEVLYTETITAETVVALLERAGIGSLFVEGGARTARMFMEAGAVDVLRYAVNPQITVGDAKAPHFDPTPYISGRRAVRRNVGGMDVAEYKMNNTDFSSDDRFMRLAVEQSRRSEPCPTAYRVGAVVVTAKGEIFAGCTHESRPTSHAEQEAVDKALTAGAELCGATIYSSMEPCTSRKSEPENCSQLIVRHRFARVVFAMFEPDCLACCDGLSYLRRHGVRVDVMPRFAADCALINSHICGGRP